MRVQVNMKSGKKYRGVKCGYENGFMYLVNPKELYNDQHIAEKLGDERCICERPLIDEDDGAEEVVPYIMLRTEDISSMSPCK